MHTRLNQVRESVSLVENQTLLISTPTNIQYLTGFAPLASGVREALLLITPKRAFLFHSPLARPPKAPRVTSLPFSKSFSRDLKNLLVKENSSTLFFEPENLTVTEYIHFKKITKLIPKKAAIEVLRQEKDHEEIAAITQACTLAKKTISFLQKHLVPGKKEKELAWLAEKYLKENGADSLAFPIIVASGPNSAIPHHTTTDRKLTRQDNILIDLGCKVSGYCSDITRTFFIGSPTHEQKRVESVVKQAHHAALSALSSKPLALCSVIDSAARKVVKTAGLAKYFIHGTGHSLGLDVHESPGLSPHSKAILKPNMVITIEPGVYLPGKFGFRHEDTILITKSGYKNLTSTS
ncbi:MAG: aminopeptidase P family protein [Candidatus Chisholmbacteria bacterium]|nr:aminopeptidase P family protein [Candidatus Chisholmbacteria bacterium]